MSIKFTKQDGEEEIKEWAQNIILEASTILNIFYKSEENFKDLMIRGIVNGIMNNCLTVVKILESKQEVVENVNKRES